LKKLIFLWVLLVFVVAPFLAYIANTSNYNPPSQGPQKDVQAATSSEFIAAIKSSDEYLRSPDQYTALSVVDSKRVTTWWYVAKIKVNNIYQSAIFSKFRSEKGSMKIVTKLGEGLSYGNISAGLGVPYSVIDEYNKNWQAGDE